MSNDAPNPQFARRLERAEQAVEKAWRDSVRADRGYEPRLEVELAETVASPGLKVDTWLCLEDGHDMRRQTLSQELLAAELSMRSRAQLGLDIDEDRARVVQLRHARGRMN